MQPWHDLPQQLQPFSTELREIEEHSCEMRSWATLALGKPTCHRIPLQVHRDNGDRYSRVPSRFHGRRASSHNDIGLELEQLAHELGQRRSRLSRKAVRDRGVLSHAVAVVAQHLGKCVKVTADLWCVLCGAA